MTEIEFTTYFHFKRLSRSRKPLLVEIIFILLLLLFKRFYLRTIIHHVQYLLHYPNLLVELCSLWTAAKSRSYQISRLS
jgi:hypothetical protein